MLKRGTVWALYALVWDASSAGAVRLASGGGRGAKGKGKGKAAGEAKGTAKAAAQTTGDAKAKPKTKAEAGAEAPAAIHCGALAKDWKDTLEDNFVDKVFTHVAFDRPLKASDGQSYESFALQKWFSRNQTSPVTRQPLPATDLLNENTDLRARTEEHLRRLPALVEAGCAAELQNLKVATSLTLAVPLRLGDVAMLRAFVAVGVGADSGTLPQAAKLGNTATVIALFREMPPGVDVNGVDADGRTALHIAARMGNTDVMNALLNANP